MFVYIQLCTRAIRCKAFESFLVTVKENDTAMLVVMQALFDYVPWLHNL